MAERFGCGFRYGPAVLVRRTAGPRPALESGRNGRKDHQLDADTTSILDSHTLRYACWRFTLFLGEF